jgi:ribosomal protein L17
MGVAHEHDRNMVSSLIEHEQIQTTVAKAKEAARLTEKVQRPFACSACTD